MEDAKLAKCVFLKISHFLYHAGDMSVGTE